ncbi:hypothetical protein C0Z18_01180 [Trinickia dabaoshanensis]|uniref:Transmembrane protein n=1 Tax=Trinickia dabaoshanensis TaxID=564714 RepID=A0A2N7W333_9BURK|nr:hypothetical protein [Trinickia dabaoshanensis]PMS23812.1 hypothetical protein C0Z18_01180 [Trinickia dabaoshanensis]
MTKRRQALARWGQLAIASFGLALASAQPVHAAEPRFAFAVVSGVMSSTADEPSAQRLIEAIGLDQRLSFMVYDGNIKGHAERCADALFARRQQLLEAAAVPVVVIPGQYDWADCASAAGGRYDAAERLDFLRQTLYSDTASLGRPTLTLTRESEVARFRAFRENVRWEANDTVFVGLNVVGGNNHYSDAGGRNGEFDDRAIASAFWLEHAAEYAKRRHAKALVVFVEADPNFSRYEEHVDRFPWLRFARRRKPDGYLEFKRSLVKATQTFRGPVVVVHHDTYALPSGFAIDQPLYDDKGERIANLTRIAIAPREPATQWIVVDVNYGRPAPFRVSVRVIPKMLPIAPTAPSAPAAPASPTQAPGPASSTLGPLNEPLPGIQYVMPAPPASAPPAQQQEPPLLPDAASAGSAPTLPTQPAPAAPASPASPANTSPAPDGTAPGAGRYSVQGGGS